MKAWEKAAFAAALVVAAVGALSGMAFGLTPDAAIGTAAVAVVAIVAVHGFVHWRRTGRLPWRQRRRQW